MISRGGKMSSTLLSPIREVEYENIDGESNCDIHTDDVTDGHNNNYNTNNYHSTNSNARVRVVVRIRPLNIKEQSRGFKTIVQSNNNNDNQLTVWDPACFDAINRPELATVDPVCWAREFAFDKCLWSVDPYKKENFATQDKVFEEVGQPVLHWLFNGYNCCVLAFGQTGAGKSFTMMGNINDDPNQYGLIPRICFGIFEMIESSSTAVSDIVTFSHMEIYNENVKDLLAPPTSSNTPAYLKVREHPQKGPFVANLTTVRVTNFEDIMSLIAIGDKNRTVASTKSNSHSSRSHAICTLTVIQRSRNSKSSILPTSTVEQKVGKVHLVDLAGSERVTLSGAKGDRLKEANHINKSLSVLGDVIKCLGDSSKSKHNKVHIPYRNSVLTTILKESLGGNSHAIMLTAISPSSYDYEETISTLKYADRAKKVRLRVDANVTSGLMATDSNAVQLVPILQAEVNKLREMLQQQQVQHDSQIDMNSSFSAESSEVVQEMRERVRELEMQLAEREKLIRSLDLDRKVSSEYTSDAMMQYYSSSSSSSSSNSSNAGGNSGSSSNSSSSGNRYDIPVDMLDSEYIHENYQQQHQLSGTMSNTSNRNHPVLVLSDDNVDISLPRVINLNQDPLFSECLVYYIPVGRVMAGDRETNADILLTGPDIVSQHVYICHDRTGVVSIEVLEGALVFVNGDIVPPHKSRVLNHYDRIAFGRFHLFRYEAEGRLSLKSSDSSQSNSAGLVSHGWEAAQQELMRKNAMSLLNKSQQSNDQMSNAYYSMQHYKDKSPENHNYHQQQHRQYQQSTAMKSPNIHMLSLDDDSGSIDNNEYYNNGNNIAVAIAAAAGGVPEASLSPTPSPSLSSSSTSPVISRVSSQDNIPVLVPLSMPTIAITPGRALADTSVKAMETVPPSIEQLMRNRYIQQRQSSPIRDINSRSKVRFSELDSSSTGTGTGTGITTTTTTTTTTAGTGTGSATTTGTALVSSDNTHQQQQPTDWWGSLSRASESQAKADPAVIRSMLMNHSNRLESVSSIISIPTTVEPAVHVENMSASSLDTLNRSPSTQASSMLQSSFEREATALQQELAHMQKTLSDRMKKYQVLVSSTRDGNK